MMLFAHPGHRRFSVVRLLLTSLLYLSLVTSTTIAQTASPTPTPGVPSVEELRRKLEEVDRKLENAPNLSVSEVSLDPNDPPGNLDSLRRYDIALRRLITLEERKDQLNSNLDNVTQELESVSARGLPEQRPFSVELLDSLQNQLDAVSEETQSANLAATAAKTSLALEKEQLKTYQALRRRLLEQLQNSSSDVSARRRLERTETAITASEAGIQLAHSELQVAELQLDLNGKTTELLQLKLQLAQDGFHFSKATLDKQLASLDQTRSLLTESLRQERIAEAASLGQLNRIRSDEVADSEQEDQLAARQEWVQTHQRRERLLEDQLEYNLIRRDLWERRYLAYNGQTSSYYGDWLDSTRGLRVRLENNLEVLNSELGQIRTELAKTLESSEEPDGSLDEWRDLRTQALISRQKALEDNILYLQETEALTKRLLAELNRKERVIPLSDRIASGWNGFKSFWNIELYTLGDSSVTVGKFSVALTILILGLALVGRVTRLVSGRFFTKLPVDAGVRKNVERLFRYLLTLLVFLFALHVVNIPLTIFTFLGGTLAIAVGFGAQNILNNFISGLILMVERPVRVGDVIQIDDTTGTVEEIGARSTRVRIPTGIHVIVPNSLLLENKVVNWTLQDHKLRTSVSVGVAYGSPPRKVMELIMLAVAQDDDILKFPAPVVTFDAFGESSLNFTVHFWLSVSTGMDRERTATKVRLNINDLFTENSIEMPFPQRDLNFNNPVPVRIVKDEEPPLQGD